MISQKLLDTSTSYLSSYSYNPKEITPSIECENSISTKAQSSIHSSYSDCDSKPHSTRVNLSFKTMARKKKNALLDGITMRLINLKWYLEYQSTTEGSPDINFRAFETEFLKKNNPLKDPEFQFESSVKKKKFSHYSSSQELVKGLTLKEYLILFIQVGEFDPCVLIMAIIYSRRAIENPKTARLIKPEGLKMFFGICILLAFKYTNDIDMWPLMEYSNFLGIKNKTLEKYEHFVVNKIFNFKLYVSDTEFQKDKLLLETLIQK